MLEELIAKASTDPKFRERLLADPKAVAMEAGFTLTEEDLAKLASAKLGETLQPRISKRLR